MRRTLERRPPKEAVNIVKTLEGLGFNTQLLGSKTYVVSKLQTLTNRDVLRIMEAFAKHRHTRFMKSFSYHLPFGTKDAYEKEIMAADLDKLANLKDLRLSNADKSLPFLVKKSTCSRQRKLEV
jgi:hypothetical protein